jgi:hypothetical protein
MCAALLHQAIRWDELRDATRELEREDWLGLVPSDLRAQVPQKAQRVLYYGTGHAQALQAEEGLCLPPMWGQTHAPMKDAVLHCEVRRAAAARRLRFTHTPYTGSIPSVFRMWASVTP